MDFVLVLFFVFLTTVNSFDDDLSRAVQTAALMGQIWLFNKFFCFLMGLENCIELGSSDGNYGFNESITIDSKKNVKFSINFNKFLSKFSKTIKL